jgi:hypothetical protein
MSFFLCLLLTGGSFFTFAESLHVYWSNAMGYDVVMQMIPRAFTLPSFHPRIYFIINLHIVWLMHKLVFVINENLRQKLLFIRHYIHNISSQFITFCVISNSEVCRRGHNEITKGIIRKEWGKTEDK